MLVRALFCGLVVVLLGCGPRASDPSPEHPAMTAEAYPTTLAVPSSWPADFAMEQDVTMHHAQGQEHFRAILQKQGATLTLVGLAPHGGRAFVLTQEGQEVTFESFMPRELPFPPRYILQDIHRAWFISAGGGVVEQDGERMEERLQGGKVVERTYRRLDGQPEGTISVRYEGGMEPGAPLTAAPPSRVVMENGWFGYRAVIESRNWQPL